MRSSQSHGARGTKLKGGDQDSFAGMRGLAFPSVIGYNGTILGAVRGVTFDLGYERSAASTRTFQSIAAVEPDATAAHLAHTEVCNESSEFR